MKNTYKYYISFIDVWYYLGPFYERAFYKSNNIKEINKIIKQRKNDYLIIKIYKNDKLIKKIKNY